VYRQAGIGASSDLSTDRTQLGNRAEVLRLLLVLLSPTIYSPNAANPWLTQLLAIPDRKVALTLLCSLLNTALDVTFLETLQLSTTNAYKRLTSLTLGAEAKQADDLANQLPRLCIQLLDILLIAEDPLEEQPSTSSPTISRNASLLSMSTSSAPPEAGIYHSSNRPHVFRLYSSKIHRQSDYAFLSERIIAILSMTPPSQLLGSNLVVSGWNVTECVVLLWRLTDCNKVGNCICFLNKPRR